MAFQLPNFNITVNIWTVGMNPATTPPRVSGAPANLAWGKRVSTMSTGGTGSAGVLVSTMTLLIESTCDIRGRQATGGSDTVEIPAGSGRYYVCETADYIGYGFPNQHKGAVVSQRFPFKTPDT